MQRSPLAALYVTILLALSVAAWSQGCVQMHESTLNRGGDGACLGGAGTAGASCLNSVCDTLTTCTNLACNIDTCTSGSCGPEVYNQYCTGGMSPWTANVYQAQNTSDTCYQWNDGVCDPTPWTTPNQHCYLSYTTTGYCWESWYNTGHPCGG